MGTEGMKEPESRRDEEQLQEKFAPPRPKDEPAMADDDMMPDNAEDSSATKTTGIPADAIRERNEREAREG